MADLPRLTIHLVPEVPRWRAHPDSLTVWINKDVDHNACYALVTEAVEQLIAARQSGHHRYLYPVR